MALIYADRIKETTTTTGTGAIALGGAVSGFRTFSSVMSVGDTCGYAIDNGSQWEVGIGTYSATSTLTRTTVLSSSNSNALVSFSGGTMFIFLTQPAARVFDNSTVLGVSSGGTGLSAIPSSGQIPIGSGTGYTLATLTAGAGITVTNAAGAITIASGSTGGPGTPTVISTNTTAVSGTNYEVNTTSAAITLTLPASPSVGAYIKVTDYAGTFFTNNLTISGNGTNIMASSSSLVVATNYATFYLIYVDATKGWSIQ